MPTRFLPGIIPSGKSGSFGEGKKQQRGIEGEVAHGAENPGTETIAAIVQPCQAKRTDSDRNQRMLSRGVANRGGGHHRE